MSDSFDVYARCRNCCSVIQRLRLPVGTPVSAVMCPVCAVDAMETYGPAKVEAEPTVLAIDFD